MMRTLTLRARRWLHTFIGRFVIADDPYPIPSRLDLLDDPSAHLITDELIADGVRIRCQCGKCVCNLFVPAPRPGVGKHSITNPVPVCFICLADLHRTREEVAA